MSLEQQNLERYRQSLEPRRELVLTAVAVVLGLFAGFTAQGSWQTWLTFRNSTDFGRTDPQFGKDISFFVFDYPFYRLALGFAFAIVLLALIGSLLTHYVFGGLRLQTPGQKLTAAARVQLSVLLGDVPGAQGGRLLAGPVRHGLLRPRQRLHRRQLHRRQRAAGAQDDPGLRRGDLRGGVLRQHLLPQLPAAGRRAGAAAGLQPGHRRRLPGDRAAVRGQAQRRPEGGALHQAGDRLDPRRLRPRPTSSTSTTRQDSHGRQVDTAAALADAAQRHPDHPQRPAAGPQRPVRRRSWPASRSATSTASRRSSTSTGTVPIRDRQETTRDYVVAARELDSAGLSGNQDNWINRHTVYTHGNGFVAAPANEVVAGQDGGEPNFTTGDLPTTRQHRGRAVARIYYGELIK